MKLFVFIAFLLVITIHPLRIEAEAPVAGVKKTALSYPPLNEGGPGLPPDDGTCTNLICACVPTYLVPVILVYCPNENINKCYQDAKCVRIGKNCKYVYDNKLRQCLNQNGSCIRGGCSGEVCQNFWEEPAITPCIYKPEFECYNNAVCGVDLSGNCRWEYSASLTQCIVNARKKGFSQ